jgi:MFS family permease
VSVLARPPVVARPPERSSPRPAAVPAWALTAAFALAYVLVAPPSADLAAAGYRSELFSSAGFTVWDNAWYGGHHLPAYSLLAPALGALLGAQLLAALSMTLATALFTKLLDGAFAARAARIASLWFAFGAAIGLLANRVPFDLGLAIGLGALVAARSASRAATARRGRRRGTAAACALAVLCTLASPIAGAFLALAAVAWALAARRSARARGERPRALALAVAALLPLALLVLAFPEGGPQPFVASAFYPTLAGVLLIAALMAPAQRLLRTGTLLYALALIVSYLIPTAVGGNVDRLGALLAGPVAAACALSGAGAGRDCDSPRGSHGGRWRVRALIAFAPLLVYWQCNAPIGNYVSAASDPAVHASFYRPLLVELAALGVGDSPRPARIEVVPTRDHAEARWLATHVMLARGWERQLDVDRNGLFYRAPLHEDEYEDWLSYAAVAYVALADAPLDYSGRAEARLVSGAPRYLREVWRSRHWRLFEVLGATALSPPPSAVTRLNGDSFTLRAPGAGSYEVRVRFTPYWALADGRGCVRRAPGGWTDVQTRGAGSVRVVIDFSLERVFDHGPRCR